MKASELIATSWGKFTAQKRIVSAVVAVMVITLSVGGYFGYQEFLKRMTVPTVSGANFSLEYRKIPYDARSLDIVFSTALDPASVSNKSVTVSPFVEGTIVLKNKNIVSYVLDKNLQIGETYSLRVGSSVRSAYGTELGEEYIFTIEAIAGAKATKILPSGKLENIGQNIIVLFNVPIVPMTNLDERDNLPCPLEIVPKIEGKCQWTNGSVLEFIPTKPFELATKYHMRVSNVLWLLYPLAEPFEESLTTPELSVSVPPIFDPKKGIEIIMTAPVNVSDIFSNLVLMKNGEKLETNIVSAKNENDTESETRFFVTPKSPPLLYGTNYAISIKKGLKPKYGTEPLGADYSKGVRGADFLSSSQVFRKIFDGSGALLDTREYDSEYLFIPSETVFFRQSFMAEVGLDKNLFTLRTASGQTVDFSLAYVRQTKYDERGKVIGDEENRQMIDIAPTVPLKKGTSYEFGVNKKANGSLIADLVKTFTTAPEFAVSGNVFLSNTETCLFFNNPLGTPYESYISEYDRITTVPTSRVQSLIRDEEINWQTNVKTYRCPQKPGQTSYILGTRFEPQKTYSIVIPETFEDVYGNKLGKDATFTVKTGNIDPKDLYLYSSLNKPVQVIPSDLPIVLNILSLNADTANTEVCEMDTAGYRDYLSNGYNPYYTPICTKSMKKTVALKNRFWNLTANKIDLEQDVLGAKSMSPFLFVRSSVGDFNQGWEGYRDYEREFAHVFIRSNLALVLEEAENTKILFAPSIEGKTVPENLTFETYVRNQKGILESKLFPIRWNGTKKYYELTDTENKLSLLIAKNDRFFGVLNKESDQVSNYDFKYIAGQDASTKDYLYLYSDRPLYRAGDTVFYKGLSRQYHFDGYRASPNKTGKLKVVDENSTVLTETDVKIDALSNFHGQFVLPKDMPLGRYRFEFYSGTDSVPVYNNGEFFVLAYKKPTFRVSVSASKTDAGIGDRAELSADAEYYFGGRLVNAEYDYSVLSQSYFFDAKDYQDYQFGKGSNYFDCIYWGSCAYGDSLVMTATGRLDSRGEAKISYDYPKTDDADHTTGEKIYTYSVEITDPDTEKTVSNSTSQILHTTDAYVGIQVPYWNPKKDGVKTNGVVLDYEAKGLSGKQVTLELWKREWKEVKKQGVDGIFYNESSREEKKESTKTVSSDTKGEFTANFSPIGDGEYEVRAIYTGANKQAFISSSILYVSGENTTYWNDGNNSVTDLIADKTMMQVGETAVFTLRSPVSGGKMLVTIEKDDGILDSFVRDIESTTPRIEVPIKESFVPNFYVKVFLIGQDTDAKLPTYKRALAVMKVTTDPKKLSVMIAPEKKQYLPGEKVKLSVTVQDSQGNPVPNANGSLSIVDESLLALAGNPLKNPFAFFYDMKRYLGTMTSISLVNLIEKLEVKDTSLGEKWGAGEGTKGGSSTKKRWEFKDTAFWQADFTTNKNGQFTVTTDALPDNLTTWVIEALVSTTEGNRVGIATVPIMTAKTVMVNENLPRFLGFSDTVTFSPVVFNKTGRDQSFVVSVVANNMTVKSPERTVFIKNGASYTVPFEATVISVPLSSLEPFASKIILKAVAKDTKESDEVENTLPIVATSTKETVATVGKTAKSADETIKLSADIRNNGGSLTVSYAASLLPNILSGIEYLKSFPYGCSEQITSAIMPTVYLKQLYDSVQVPFDLTNKTVKEYIDPYQGYQERSLDTVLRGYLVEIRNFQHLNGGFGYWKESKNEDYPLTISLVSAFSDIRSIGYTPSEAMVEDAVRYLKQKFYENKRPYCAEKDCGWETSVWLATIEAILDSNPQDYEAYKMYKLIPFPTTLTRGDAQGAGGLDNLTQVNRVRVLAKLLRITAITKEEKDVLTALANEQIKSIVSNGLVYNSRGAFLGSSLESSRLDTTAKFLEAIALTPTLSQGEREWYEQIVDQMERWIIGEKQKDGSFGSTADTSNVIRSLAHVMRATGELRDVNMQAKISLDTVSVDEKAIDQKNKLDIFSKIIGLDKFQDNSNLHLEKNGQGNLYYDIALSYRIPSKDVPARDEGFLLEQYFYDYDSYKSVKKTKEEEWLKYMSGSIDFSSLKYPKEIVTYLKPLETLTVGKLVYVHNRVITGEARDQVAFEGFIPSGAELVNPELKTESKDVAMQHLNNFVFEHEEYRDDRYFGTAPSLEAGVYGFGYILRPTHAGTYQLLPSRVFEFYNPEVFGRTGGKVVEITEGK